MYVLACSLTQSYAIPIPALLDENLSDETSPGSMLTPAASPPPQIDDDETLSSTD